MMAATMIAHLGTLTPSFPPAPASGAEETFAPVDAGGRRTFPSSDPGIRPPDAGALAPSDGE